MDEVRLQIISHTARSDVGKLVGRWSIVPHYLKKDGVKIDFILRDEWASILRRYRSFKPDVIITVGGVIGAWVAFLRKIGLINVPVIHEWVDNYVEVMAKYPSKIISFLENYIIKNSDLITTQSKYREEICKKIGKPVIYIAQGVFSELFCRRVKRLDKGFHVIYTGEISYEKGIGKLLHAAKKINDIKFYIIGDKKKEIENVAPPNVIFKGFMTHEEYVPYLKGADVLVVTQNNDSTLKLAEYIRARRPIVVPEGKIRAFVEKKKAAILTFDFAEAINKLKNSPKLRKELIKNCKKMYVPDWSEIGHEYLKILLNMTIDAKGFLRKVSTGKGTVTY